MLQDKLKQLAALNRAIEENQAWLETKEERLKSLPEYQELEKIRTEKSQLQSQIGNVRAEINDLTLAVYQQTGNKKPAPGVGIRVLSKLEYNEQVAFDYCSHNLLEALKLDKRVFDKYARGVQEVKPLEFVTIIEEPSPTIASDLREYLGDE